MSILDSLKSPEHLGTIAVCIGDNARVEKAPIRIAETHANAFDLFSHLCFVFEDCTYVLAELGPLMNIYAQHRANMADLLNEVGEMFFRISLHKDRFTGSVFEVGKNVVSAVSPPFALEYQSEIYRRGEILEFKRTKYSSHGSIVPAPPYQHLAVFALFNHMLTRAIYEYEPGSLELVRLGIGVGTLLQLYDKGGAVSSMAILKPQNFGKIPSRVIQHAQSFDTRALQDALVKIRTSYT